MSVEIARQIIIFRQFDPASLENRAAHRFDKVLRSADREFEVPCKGGLHARDLFADVITQALGEVFRFSNCRRGDLIQSTRRTQDVRLPGSPRRFPPFRRKMAVEQFEECLALCRFRPYDGMDHFGKNLKECRVRGVQNSESGVRPDRPASHDS
jgi:hypothetical protein